MRISEVKATSNGLFLSITIFSSTWKKYLETDGAVLVVQLHSENYNAFTEH